ncbi:MAG: glutamine synthetase family protein [Hyphomicrobiales bacterium]
MNSKSEPTELDAYLKANPHTELADVLLPDMNGILRGKQLSRAHISDLYQDGIRMPISSYLLDWRGQNIEAIGYGSGDGDPDAFALAAPGSIVPVPWAKRSTAQVMVSLHDEEGNRHFACPRQVLENAAKPLLDMGLKIVIAIEYEFYLVTRDTQTGAVKPAPGKSGHMPSTVNVYGLDDLYEHGALLDEIYASCEVQGIPAETFVSEYAPGQYEINLYHCDDALKACDNAILLERCIKEVARKHGVIATFMAKPFAETAGCGLHVHVSLIDKDGNNVFAGPVDEELNRPVSDMLRHAAGGLLSTMDESTALYAPNANSFRRLRPDSYAPIYSNWGSDNRSVSVRIPGSNEKNIRLEHRVAGADANPYLVVAGVLAGLHHGITEKIEPPAPVIGDGYAQGGTNLPLNWNDALDAFKASKVMPKYLGEQYAQVFEAARRSECNDYQAFVPPLDYEWYLRTA